MKKKGKKRRPLPMAGSGKAPESTPQNLLADPTT